jgi:4-hydroxy 2-oxovalerate aldolase
MAVSTAKESDLNGALEELNESPVDIVYVVDSFGSLVPDDVKYLIDKYHHYVHTKKLGIHTHNNMQLAFSNTLLAMNAGIEYLDSSIYGMGRAAGNCPTELLLAYLGSSSYDIVPILDVLARRFVPLREQIEWGYTIPYMLTGAFNEHPRIAMAARGGDEKDNYVGFYETMTSVETHQHHM